MNRKRREKVLKKPLCTWLTVQDYEKFKALARREKLSLASYLRSIVVDAIVEEAERAIRPWNIDDARPDPRAVLAVPKP